MIGTGRRSGWRLRGKHPKRKAAKEAALAILGPEAGTTVPETCLKLRYVFAEKRILMLHRW